MANSLGNALITDQIISRRPRRIFVWAKDRLIRMERHSHQIARFLARAGTLLATIWLTVFGVAAFLRLNGAIVPMRAWSDFWPMALPYLLIAVAPLAGFLVAAHSFPAGLSMAQPTIRFAVFGRWRAASVLEVRQNPAFGPAGFLASLLIGLLLNVAVRSLEFVVATPPLNGHAPDWGQGMFLLMAADVVVMNFFYTVCFVMALRSVPWFPRMLLFTWGVDILAQLMIAQAVAGMHDLPVNVAEPLATLLRGNITKVLISAFVWLPYLILSDRVNLTYRRRVRA